MFEILTTKIIIKSLRNVNFKSDNTLLGHQTGHILMNNINCYWISFMINKIMNTMILYLYNNQSVSNVT